MKKILILLGLITSLAGASKALASAHSSRALSCALLNDAENADKFASLGYEVARFNLVLGEREASLAVVRADGSILEIGHTRALDVQDGVIFAGWDHNENWMELKQEGEAFTGVITIEEDFMFSVSCAGA